MRLPLFPLGAVLFPGLVLPLHIFEERYRTLVRELLAQPAEQRRFGVIAIRAGRETGVAGVTALHEVGCVAAIREVTEHGDGRYDLVTVGTMRFRLLGLHEPQGYLVGEVAGLPEVAGNDAEAALAAPEVQRGFRGYLDALATKGPASITIPTLPDEPLLLSYLVAAAMVVDLTDRQDLLAQPDAVSRLAAERRLLARETALLTSLGTTPAPDLRSSPYSPN
jgi:Lon protease-like protein